MQVNFSARSAISAVKINISDAPQEHVGLLGFMKFSILKLGIFAQLGLE
jgi:hypothetical protein